MLSSIARALSLKYPPLAIFYAQEAPVASEKFKPMCVMHAVAKAAMGKTVAITQGTCGCPGAGQGLGLEPSCPDDFPGGRECFLRFLSIGNQDWDHGRAMMEKLIEGGAPKILIDEFAEGEGFVKTPELVAQYLEEVPRIEPEGPYVVVKPLEALETGEKPKVVAFLVEPDQLSALTVLTNFARPGIDNVRIPFCSGCASVGLFPFFESEQTSPRAVIGLTDISARFFLRKLLGRNILSFSVPWALFEEMEGNVNESFLTRHAWKTIMAE